MKKKVEFKKNTISFVAVDGDTKEILGQVSLPKKYRWDLARIVALTRELSKEIVKQEVDVKDYS